MNRLNIGCYQRLVHQRGAVVLMTVTLLLMVVTLTTLYTGRSQSFEHQILINQTNHIAAFIAADAGLQKALSKLKINKHLASNVVNEIQDDKSAFTIQYNFKKLNTDLGERTIVDLSITGTSADGLGSVIISEKALIFPLLVNKPIAPLIVQDGVGSNIELELAANSHGLGWGQPLSIWSNNVVDTFSVNSATCLLADYNVNQCLNISLSNNSGHGQDIRDNSPHFPTNLFGYLFNFPINAISHLQEQANHLVSDCSNLNAATHGFIWVKGDCQVGLGSAIGTVSAPAIVLVQDGNIEFDKGVTMYGVLISYRDVSVPAIPQIQMLGDAHVRGAVVSNHPLGGTNDRLAIVYDDSVLSHLVSQHALLQVVRVPGSWKDF